MFDQSDRREFFHEERHQLSPQFLSRVHKQLFDNIYGYDIWTVNGDIIRAELDIDFTSGGNPARYGYVPHGEIWIELISPASLVAVTVHEIIECIAMTNGGFNYDDAHDIANNIELNVRNNIINDWVNGELLDNQFISNFITQVINKWLTAFGSMSMGQEKIAISNLLKIARQIGRHDELLAYELESNLRKISADFNVKEYVSTMNDFNDEIMEYNEKFEALKSRLEEIASRKGFSLKEDIVEVSLKANIEEFRKSYEEKKEKMENFRKHKNIIEKTLKSFEEKIDKLNKNYNDDDYENIKQEMEEFLNEIGKLVGEVD